MTKSKDHGHDAGHPGHPTAKEKREEAEHRRDEAREAVEAQAKEEAEALGPTTEQFDALRAAGAKAQSFVVGTATGDWGKVSHIATADSNKLTVKDVATGKTEVHRAGSIVDEIENCKLRLYHYQQGGLNCPENDRAIECLDKALGWLEQRTRARELRGVEGTGAP